MTVEEYKEEAKHLRRRLFVAASKILGDEDDADDVVQDTLLKLWLMCEEVSPPLAPLALVIVRNLSIDRLRRKRPDCGIESVDVGDTESAGAEECERIERMMTVVESLPGMQQTVLRLRHMQGMEMSEIAELLGCSEVAVRKALSRARMAVRDKYKGLR